MLAPFSKIIWMSALLAASGYALWRGGRVERATGAAMVAAYGATLLMQDRQNWFDPQLGILAVDGALLLFFVGLGLSTDRTWLLFASAFQLLGVVIHLAIIADAEIRSLAYLRALTIWSYLILVALMVGTWLQARARASPDP